MEQPNIVIIVADDVTYNDLPAYGGRNVETPGIDRLAAEGTVFTNAYLSMAMCNPCRTELYTGLYPARSGSCWNHSAARPGTRSVVQHLGDLGYRVGLAGKKHVGPNECFPFEDIPGLTRGCCNEVTEFDAAGMREFMARDRKQPFCLVVGLVEAHSPWTMGDPSHFDPRALNLAPFMADTEETRRTYAKYLAEVEVLDDRVDKTLQAIQACGRTEDTLVIFTSEQGCSLPGCKWTNWNTGVHTAFIARWPGNVEAGRRTAALIQYADVLPTLMAAAGGDPLEADLDGSSFLPVLSGETATHRSYAYFMHNNIPEGPPYPIRAVTDGCYHYIRNLRSEALYIEKHLMGEEIHGRNLWESWLKNAALDRHAERCVQRYMRRPREQLYNVREDPFEMTNCADDSAYAEDQRRLSDQLDRWMQSQGDPGALLDTADQWHASRQGKHFQPQPSSG